MKKGDRVEMIAPHAQAGMQGDFVQLKHMALGLRYVIALSNGQRTLAKDGEFKHVRKGAK